MDLCMIQLKHPSNLEVKGSWVWNKNIFDAGALLTSKYLRYGRHCIAISAKREFTIGYGSDCDIVYMNPCVSDKHCILWFEYSSKSVAPTCFIKDVSVSGTYINGNLLGNGNVTIVKDLDIVRIGRFQEFRILELYNQVTTISESERTNFKKCFPKWDIVGPAIGYGAFGSVHKVRKRDSLNVFAIKISKKNYVLDYKSLFLEAVILSQLNHPNIIKLYHAAMVNGTLYLVQDWACGGDLFSYLNESDTLKSLPEKECVLIIFQLLKALDYLHNVQLVIHRDIKLENILLKHSSPGSRIFLCDFGFAKRLTSLEQKSTSIKGTLGYTAPEIFDQSKGYTFKCDMWSLGVVSYSILTGASPFISDNNQKNSQNCHLNFKPQHWNEVSSHPMDFTYKLLELNSDLRLSVSECFNHDWISKYFNELEICYKKIISN